MYAKTKSIRPNYRSIDGGSMALHLVRVCVCGEGGGRGGRGGGSEIVNVALTIMRSISYATRLATLVLRSTRPSETTPLESTMTVRTL